MSEHQAEAAFYPRYAEPRLIEAPARRITQGAEYKYSLDCRLAVSQTSE